MAREKREKTTELNAAINRRTPNGKSLKFIACFRTVNDVTIIMKNFLQFEKKMQKKLVFFMFNAV